jgi:hypothetical protein
MLVQLRLTALPDVALTQFKLPLHNFKLEIIQCDSLQGEMTKLKLARNKHAEQQKRSKIQANDDYDQTL